MALLPSVLASRLSSASKVEPLAHAAFALGYDKGTLGNMRAQAAEFFIHIGFLHKERTLLQTYSSSILPTASCRRVRTFPKCALSKCGKSWLMNPQFYCAQRSSRCCCNFSPSRARRAAKSFSTLSSSFLKSALANAFIFALAREHAGKFQNIGHAELGQIFMLLAPFAVEPSQLRTNS